MSFTVALAAAGNNRREFEAYVRLLEKRGIDWTNAPRVPEPGTKNRWLYVWPNREAAEAFCQELRSETRNDRWHVREVADGAEGTAGSLARVVILMRERSLGADFSLHPHSRALIRRRFPDAHMVSNVSIEWGRHRELDEHEPLWDHVALVLTGLSMEELETLEGYQVYDLKSERTIHDSLVPLQV